MVEKENKLYDYRGFCTAYAHGIGYVDSAEKNGDKLFITMGLSGYNYEKKPIYFVKVRGENPSWESFDNYGKNAAGAGNARDAAHRRFMKMIRETGAIRQIGPLPK